MPIPAAPIAAGRIPHAGPGATFCLLPTPPHAHPLLSAQVLSPALQEERLDAFIGWQETDAKEKNKRQPAWQRVLYTESLDDEAMTKTALTHTAKLLGEAQVWGDTHNSRHETSSQHADQMM